MSGCESYESRSERNGTQGERIRPIGLPGEGIVDEYAGRVLADRYRLPLPPSDEYELAETVAFDTYSGQEVMVRQVPLPEVVIFWSSAPVGLYL